MQTNFSFLCFHPSFFNLSWRTQFFLLSKNKNSSNDFFFSHSMLNRWIFVLFYLGNGLYTKEGLWEELVLFSVLNKFCCEASDLHSVVRRINVEPFPFCVCEQLLLSNCKMQLLYIQTHKIYVLYFNVRLPSVTTVLKHYVLQVTSPYSKNAQENSPCDLQENVLFVQTYAETNSFRRFTLNSALVWDDSTSEGIPDLFVVD